MKVLLVIISAIFTAFASAKPLITLSTPAFIQGKYTVVGREAGSGRPYVGMMRVENVDNKTVRMIETVKKQPKHVWIGQFRAAAPGEGWVLAVEGKQGNMACLVSSDLDNYARLTCLWKSPRKASKILGLLALFPTLEEN